MSLDYNPVTFRPRCPKCYCPNNVIAEIGHNKGCPDHTDATEADQVDWIAGRKAGFDDIDDVPIYTVVKNKGKAFAFGYRAGKDLSEQLIDEATQSRIFG